MKRILILFIFCSIAWGTEKKGPVMTNIENSKEMSDEEEVVKNFKETKFLQVDQLDLPEELKKIEEQLRQNLVDVIILSKTHTPVYAQKRENGYTDQYKKFHSANLLISKIPNVEDYYALKISYQNWTTNKFDKAITKRISKYNVLNESRFAMFELLLGREIVERHRDQLELENFKRIQAVRQSIEEQKKIDRKDKKKQKEKEVEKQFLEEELKKKNNLKKREDKEKEKKTNLEVDASETEIVNNLKSDLEKEIEELETKSQTPEIEKKIEELKKQLKKRRKKSEIEKNNPEKEVENQVLPENKPDKIDNPSPVITYKWNTKLFGAVSLFSDVTNNTTLNLATETNLRYLGIGMKLDSEQMRTLPWGYHLGFKAGIPIKKQNYKFPVYRSIESDIYLGNFISNFKFFGGFDFTPIYFVSLPGFGQTLQVFENDFLWGKIGGIYDFEIYQHKYEVKISFMQSLIMKSNQTQKLSGTKINLGILYNHDSKKSAEFIYQQSYLDGDIYTDSKSVQLNFYYRFEN